MKCGPEERNTDMSYCVNCGVELEQGVKECPLCNTPVINPRELEKIMQEGSFPTKKGQVETVKRKDMGILITVMVLATAFTCGMLNALVFSVNLWSLPVIGVCAVFWVLLIPFVIYTRLPIYLTILMDGAAVGAYLYLLTFLTKSDRWFLGLGAPITILITVVAELVTVCFCKLPKSFLTGALYCVSSVAVVCVGIEILIDLYVSGAIALSWSAVVLTVCFILDVTFVTMLCHSRLRGAVRRRLHF